MIARRGGWTLLELMAVITIMGMLAFVIGPISVRLIEALRDDPGRIEQLRVAHERLDRIGRDIRCARGVVVEEKALGIDLADRVRVYRITDDGMLRIDTRDGDEIARELTRLPLAGRFEKANPAAGVAVVKVAFELTLEPDGRKRWVAAEFAPRTESVTEVLP
jgi:prepilin-type N-terminal cleavage/methylation domain-containing protein